MLAIYPQARAKQREKAQFTNIDEKYAIQLAGLSATYKSNPRMARKKLKEKLDKIQAANAISGWESTEDGSFILHFRKPEKQSK